MTMTLGGNLDEGLHVCRCFVWVARLAVVVCLMWSYDRHWCFCTGFRPVPLQMNRSILFCFFK